MKKSGTLLWACWLTLSFGCARVTEKDVNRRNAQGAEPSRSGQGTNGSGDATVQADLSPLVLQLAKNSELAPADFFKNISGISKIKEDQIILFGKNGKSWVYGSTPDQPPKVLEPSVVGGEGAQLFTLPESEFWLVKADEVGRRKAGSVEQGSITIERFSTAALQGNREKMRVLYAGVNDLILDLETSIAILSIREGQALLNQFDTSKLPVDLGGSIRAAGRGQNDSFWFAAGDQIAIVESKSEVFSWKKSKIPMPGFEDYTHLALWIDPAAKQVLGDSLMLQGEKIWSVSGAPLAAAPAAP